MPVFCQGISVIKTANIVSIENRKNNTCLDSTSISVLNCSSTLTSPAFSFLMATLLGLPPIMTDARKTTPKAPSPSLLPPSSTWRPVKSWVIAFMMVYGKWAKPEASKPSSTLASRVWGCDEPGALKLLESEAELFGFWSVWLGSECGK